MLDHIKELEQAGRWDELHQLAETLPNGDNLARVHIALSRLQEDHATTADEYRVALTHAQQGIATGNPNGLMWTWAHGRTAALAADLGDYRTAQRSAATFFVALPDHPQAQALAPWVHFACGRSLAAHKQFHQAIHHYQQALAANIGGTLQERVQLALVWAYARSGMVRAAALACPSSVENANAGNLLAARAAILTSAGNLTDACRVAKEALALHRTSPLTCDVVEIAEVALILHTCASSLGMHGIAHLWRMSAAHLLSCDDEGLNALVVNHRVKGGVSFDEAVSRGLPDGNSRCGMLGVLG